MKFQPHVAFNGQCEAAFKYYEQRLGGKITFMMKYGESPMAGQVPADWHGKILHASMSLGDSVLMGVDAPPEKYEAPKNIALSLSVDDPAEAERLFQSIAEKGKISMPIAETFWAARFGMVVDRFGIPWMVNCEKKG